MNTSVPRVLSSHGLTKTLAYFTNISGAWFRVTNNYVYLKDDDGAATLLSVRFSF